MPDGRALLSEFALANSLAILAGLFYVAFFGLGLVSPEIFRFLFNAQFLGADVASLLPKTIAIANFLGTVVTLILTGWVFGYVWAWLYNRLARYF